MKKSLLLAILALAVCSLLAAGPAAAKVSEETGECLECHTEGTLGIVKQWDKSQPLERGSRVLRVPQGRKG